MGFIWRFIKFVGYDVVKLKLLLIMNVKYCGSVFLALVLSGSSLLAQEPVKVSVAQYMFGKECATSFTFDDGNKDNYTIAVPELEKRGWRGTFWLNCSRIPGEIRQQSHRVTWDDVRAMHAAGHEMSNHGWDHKRLPDLTHEEMLIEMEKNDSAIFVNTGVRPITYCYAYNAFNDEVLALASKGRVGTRTRQYPFGEQSSDEQLRERMDKSILEGDWAVWMTHGLTRGYDHFSDVSRFPSFLDYVKQHEDRIWVATFKDVAAYVAERDSIIITRKYRKRKVEITPSLTLDAALFNLPLTMCVEGIADFKARQDGKYLDVYFKGGKGYFEFNPHGGKIIIRYY